MYVLFEPLSQINQVFGQMLFAIHFNVYHTKEKERKHVGATLTGRLNRLSSADQSDVSQQYTLYNRFYLREFTVGA